MENMEASAIRAFKLGDSVPTIRLPLTQTVVRALPVMTLFGRVRVRSLIVTFILVRVLEERGRETLNRVHMHRIKLE